MLQLIQLIIGIKGQSTMTSYGQMVVVTSYGRLRRRRRAGRGLCSGRTGEGAGRWADACWLISVSSRRLRLTVRGGWLRFSFAASAAAGKRYDMGARRRGTVRPGRGMLVGRPGPAGVHSEPCESFRLPTAETAPRRHDAEPAARRAAPTPPRALRSAAISGGAGS